MTGVTTSDRWQTKRARWANAYHARRSGFAGASKGFATPPEPRTIGSYAKGRQLVAGHLQLGGELVEAPGVPLWEVEPPSPAFRDEAQGCAWLDDLAAAGSGDARRLAQDWVWGWIDRYGKGIGPGWTPELTARRLIRWINNAQFLLGGKDAAEERRFFKSLTHQTVYLSRRWDQSEHGLPRYEALTGLICAGLALQGMERRAKPAIEALARECKAGIDHGGGIPTRNPEELMEVLSFLTWSVAALQGADQRAPRRITEAMERIAPTLRALRHADGGLARFHGGGRGADGRLDQALVASGVRTPPGPDLAMGFARLAAGRTSVIVDAARPPRPAAAHNAHASATAFELTSGRRPVIVNCGSGISFGQDWRRAGRATPLHSALCIEGLSSARLGPKRQQAGILAEPLVEGPSDVWVDRSGGLADGEYRLSMSHDGWMLTHGLTCFRELVLSTDGRELTGEDSLAAMSDEEKYLFDCLMEESETDGVGFTVRFHLHPDAEAELDLGETGVEIALRSGEAWVFRNTSDADLSIAPSVYLERGRLKPRPSQQIVLTSRVSDYTGMVGWTLAKTVDTPSTLRDKEVAEMPLERR